MKFKNLKCCRVNSIDCCSSLFLAGLDRCITLNYGNHIYNLWDFFKCLPVLDIKRPDITYQGSGHTMCSHLAWIYTYKIGTKLGKFGQHKPV